MLLLAVAVYDLPTGTVSLCLAVDSARTAVGRSTMPARQSGTRCLMNLEIADAHFIAFRNQSVSQLIFNYDLIVALWLLFSRPTDI